MNSAIDLFQKMDNNQKTLPPIARQSSKQRPNLLAKRLYKNNSMKKLNTSSQFSYLKNINPDSSILASTMTRNNSSKNLLIPSVSLKRGKDNDNSQRSLQITQGKILVSKIQEPSFLHYKGDLKHQLQKTSTKHKTLFKKLPGYDSINESKIVPDELLGCSSDQQSSVNESKLLQRFTVSPKSQQSKLLKGFKSKQKKFLEDDQTLTPNDFIQLVQEDGSITNQFCYLKKMSHPYDLRIVEFQSSNSNSQGMDKATITKSMIPPSSEYITISSRGVSYFSQQNSRFVPLDRWKKQAYFFNKLMKLDFFVNFRLMKSFAKWKKHIRKTAMRSTSQKLRSQLMLGDKYLRRALLTAKQNCFIMQTDINYCKLDDCENVMQFHAYKSSQQQFIQNDFQRRIIQTQQEIKNSLIENMSESMKQFKQENKISSSSEGKGIPLLIGDEKNLDMPYTKQATLRTQQQKFKKFLKLVEFMIVDSKTKMMKQSTQKIVNKVQQQNDNYQKQVLQTDYKLLFKGKQYIKCNVKLSLQQKSILLKPSRDDLNYMFEQIVNKAIVKLCRNHKRISNDEDILQIIYDSNEKVIKQPQTNLLKMIIMGDDRQQKIVSMINTAINKSYSFLQLYCDKFMYLVEIYFNNLNKLHTIESYEAKDHQMIAESLDKWKSELLEISSLYQEHQSAIFVLDFQQFKHSAMKCVTECLEKMKRLLPEIFFSTTEHLLNELEMSQDKIKVKPIDVEDFIEFQKNKAQITTKMEDFSDRLAEINCINIIIKGYSAGSDMTNLSRQEREINKLQSRLNTLRTKLEQAQMNTKTYQNRAQQLLKAKIPSINQNIIQLYLNIKNQKFNLQSDTYQVAQALKSYKEKHQKIFAEIKQLKEFQMQLSIEEFNEETFNKFTLYFNHYQNIWKLHQEMTTYQNEIMNSPWTAVNIEQAQRSVDHFISQANKLKKIITSQSSDDEEFKIQLNDIDVVSYVFLEAKNMKPLIETVQCLRDKSLGEKEWREIKGHFEKNDKQNVCKIIDVENKTATLLDIQKEKVTQELDFIHSVVLRSKKQLEIHNKMSMVNKFWIQSSASNAGKNLAQNFQKYYWDIITQIDQKITVINGISEDTTQVQAQELRQNITQNKQMFDTLRVLLVEWEVHQRYLHYFEPIFMNPYWKSNTKQLKLYNQAEMNWKKLLKQCKDYSLKRWASNEKAIVMIRQNIVLFEELKKAVQDFLTVKRDTFPKFYFLSNEQLLHVLLTQKEVRNVEQQINKVFTCVKSLQAKQPGQILVSTQIQSIQTKFAKAFNTIEIEQIFKMLEQGIKSAIKSNFRSCMTNFQKDDFVKKKWVKDHLLQSLLFIQKSEYTKIIEYDYMGPEAQDLSQYIIYQNSQVKELQSYLKDHSEEQGMNPGKIETLILQQILHRDMTSKLLNNRIIDEESYEWQKHIRCYYSIENVVTKFFVNEIQYGYEFVNLVDAYPYVSMSDREAMDLVMGLKLKHLLAIKGRQSLINNFAKFNAKYFKNVLCESKLSEKYLLNVCYGTYLSGSYVQLQNAQNLQTSQLSVMANFLKQIYSAVNRKDKSFNFGWKKNNLNFYSGIVFKLSDTSNFPQFQQKLILPSRSFEFKSIPYQLYVNLVLQARKHGQQDLGQKVMKIIEIVNQLQEYQVIHFYHIKNILSLQKSKGVENNESYLIKKLQQLITQKIISPKKVAFYKKIMHSIFQDEKNLNQVIQNQSTFIKEKVTRQKSDFKFVVNSLVQITDKKSLCIVAGSTQSGKISVISQAYKQRVHRESQVEIFNLDTFNEQSLFGCYVNDLWKQGILIQKIKSLSASKQEWIIFEGEYSRKIQEIICRLNHPYLQLSNGQIVFLSNHWKFIFSVFNLDDSSILWSKNIHIISSNKFITIEESMYLMMEKRIKGHFQNIDNYNQLSNMCINKVEKVLDLLKTIGFKNDYLKPQNILRYFINILDALLTNIPSQIKASKEFSKGIEKIFIWSIYWCVGSGLPESSASKYEKSIFQAIKTDVERSQSISYLKLQFETPAGHLKKIKNTQVNHVNGQLYYQTLDLKSKANFVELMIKGNSPIILTGKTGSGKSKFMEYLQFYLNSEQYAYLPVRLRKQMTFLQFKDILFKKTRISIKQSKRKCFCSSTSKRLIIFIDDFNLLDLQSQIGQFLVSCIKNGFYYDTTTYEKIYLYNISFVVAENDTYENRMENRFLKFFKPIYINEIQLKDIAEIYKQQFSSIQFSKEIFDSTVSLHNYVMNLQSCGQIKKQVPFSHKNALRIMKTISQYKPTQQITQNQQNKNINEKSQNMAKIWAYAAKIQYSSHGIRKQTQQKIDKQIKNLLNLVIQNSNEKPKPVSYITELLEELQKKNNLIKTDADFESYYEYLSFLISLSQPHNLLSINEPLPQFIKKVILSHVADVHSLKFFSVQKVQALKICELKNTLIYLSYKNLKELITMISYIMNNAECKSARYIIDFQNQQDFGQLITDVPSIFQYFHIFTKKQTQSKQLISSQYKDWLDRLENFLSRTLTHRQTLTIISNLLEKERFFKSQIQKKKINAQRFIERYLKLQNEIQKHKKQIQELNQNMNVLHSHQEQLFLKKKQDSQSSINLKNTKAQNQEQQERIQKIKKLQEQIHETQNQLKVVKTKKKDLSEKISNLQAANNLEKQIEKKLVGMYENFLQSKNSLQDIQKDQNSVIFCFSLYYYGIKNEDEDYSNFIENQISEGLFDINHSLKIIFDINPSSITKEILVWLMQNRSLVVKDKYHRFLRQMKKAVPKLRVFEDIHSLSNQYERLIDPIVYIGKYDPILSKIEKCTYIIKQQTSEIIEGLKNRSLITVKDSAQNQKENIRAYLYKHKEREIYDQIKNFEEQIYRFHVSSWDDNQRIFSEFLDPKSHDFKHLKSILYFQNDRVKQLSQGLSKSQEELQRKYSEIIQTCALFKSFLSQLESKFGYFFYNEDKFLQLCLNCISIKPSGQKTRKRLFEAPGMSKKSLKTTKTFKSKRQMTTQKQLSKKNLQTQNNLQPSQLILSQNNSMVDLKLQEQNQDKDKDNNIETFRNLMIDQILRKISLSLKGQDFLEAYTLLTSFLLEKQFGISSLLKQTFKKIIKREKVSKQYIEKLSNQIESKFIKTVEQDQGQVRLIQITNSLKFLIQSLKDQNTSSIQKAINLSDLCLSKSFDELLQNKFDIDSFEQQQNILVVSNPYDNPFEIVEKYIFENIEDTNWCYLSQRQVSYEKILQVHQKCAVNWIVLIDQIDPRVLDYLKQAKTDKNINFVLLFTEQARFMELKRKIQLESKTNSLEQLILVYAQEQNFIQKKIGDIYLNHFSRLINQERLQIQQIARIVLYEQTNKVLKEIYLNQDRKGSAIQKENKFWTQFYLTRALNQVVTNLKNIDINNFIRILNNLCFRGQNDKQNIVLKEGKKIVSKNEDLLFNFVAFFGNYHIAEDINFEGNSFISQVGSILIETFSFITPQQVVNLFVPPQYKKKFPLDSLYFQKSFESKQNKQISTSQQNKFNQQKSLSEIDQMLNQLPCIAPLQSQSGKKEKLYYKQILKHQIKNKVNTIKRIQQTLKKYKRVIQTPKIFSLGTERQFMNLIDFIIPKESTKKPIKTSNFIESLTGYLTKQQKTIQYLENFFQSKDTNKTFQPLHFKDPYRFLRFYLLQMNSHVNYLKGDIVARFLTDKERQTHVDEKHHPPCKTLVLSQIIVKNGKFDPIKNTIENNDKNEPSKIANVQITFSDKEHPNLTSLVSVSFDGKKLVDLHVINKVRDESIWKEKLCLEVSKSTNQ